MMEEAYKNYLKNWEPQKIETDEDPMYWMDQKLVNNRALPQDVFIHCIKTDDKFANTWGVKVEVRELSLEERMNLIKDNNDNKMIIAYCENPSDIWLEDQVNNILTHRNIPTKVIYSTYDSQTIETYE
jgi:hypothetical protein